MRGPLNSPVEIGVRVLMLLSEAFPARLDLNELVLLDHGLLHSGDIGGPESLHPPLPIRSGEFGIKRRAIDSGLAVVVRAGLAQIDLAEDGIRFRASESAEGFLALLATSYASALHERASWVVGHYSGLDEETLRHEMREAFAHWTEEFEPFGASGEAAAT